MQEEVKRDKKTDRQRKKYMHICTYKVDLFADGSILEHLLGVGGQGAQQAHH